MSMEGQYDLLMRTYPHTYAEYVTMDPETGKSDWQAARHHIYISKRIAEGIAKGNARIVVNLGPGTGKSSLISKWVPTWYLEMFPKHRIMCCSHGADLAQFWGRSVRDEVETNPRIRIKLKEDSKAAGQWNTKEGGGMKCDGVGGGILGFRFNLGLIDDPIKDYQDASSPTVRENLWNWLEYTFKTRREPNASIIILMHRWHVDDICGQLIKKGGDNWEVISLPSIAGKNDPMGRKEGESIWPERWPVASFEEAKRSLAWDAMYQQDPKRNDGDLTYDRFNQEINIDTLGRHHLITNKDTPLAISYDFNVNPGMHLLIGQFWGSQDMVYFDDELHGHRWRTEKVTNAFVEWCMKRGFQKNKPETFPWKVVHIYGDRSGRSDSTVTTDTDYKVIMRILKEAGIPYKMFVPYKNPPVNARVITMNEALRDNYDVCHMKVSKRCSRLINDLENQPRDESGQPDKSDDTMGHAGDAAGYFVYWVRPAARDEFKTPQRAGARS